MDRYATLIIFFFGFCMFSSYAVRLFHYVNQLKTWDDAQLYCRENYDDLATLKKKHLETLSRPDIGDSVVWIGLRDYPENWKDIMHNKTNAWRWSTHGATGLTEFENWYPGEPDNLNGEFCVFVDSLGMWSDGECESLRSFVCLTESPEGEKTFEFVPTLETWNDARYYCRSHHTELAMIETELENTNISNIIPANATGWIGMFRLSGAWSDGFWNLFRNWEDGQPGGGTQYCVAEQLSHTWVTSDCGNTYPFMCYEDRPSHQVMVRMKIKTDADMTDAANRNNLLQQLASVLTSRGLAHITVQWKIKPRKLKKPFPTEDGCDVQRGIK